MEVIAAVLIGALLWLIGPGRKFWSVAAAGTVGEREARRTLHSSLAAAREPSRMSVSPRPPSQRASRLSVAPVTSEPPPPPAAGLRAPSPPLPTAVPARAAHAQLRRTPITLGVALLLQVLSLIALSALSAVAYTRLEHEARTDAEAVEQRLTVQLSALRTALANSQQALAALEAAAAAQTRALERIEARIEVSAPKARSDVKSAPTKAAH